jgi:hypothetical protein
MKADRRRFLKYSAVGFAVGASACSNERIDAQADNGVPPSIRALKPMTDGIVCRSRSTSAGRESRRRGD